MKAATLKPRAKKKSIGRCCWVCGGEGGAGFTVALRLAGYDVPEGQMGYAHPTCMRRALDSAAANTQK